MILVLRLALRSISTVTGSYRASLALALLFLDVVGKLAQSLSLVTVRGEVFIRDI